MEALSRRNEWELGDEIIYDMYIYALYKKKKEIGTSCPTAKNHGECEIESLVLKRSDQKRNTSSQAFVLFCPDLADDRRHHLLIFFKTSSWCTR